MIKIRRKLMLQTTLLAGMALIFSNTAFAEDKKKPELMTGASTTMLANTCAGCHGGNGVSMGPSIPTLAGMSSAYFVEVMEGYQSDKIPSTIMGRLAKGYSDEEVTQLAEYFSKQKFVAATGQTVDAAKAKKGEKLHDKYCEKCHSELGTVADDDSGFLQGQWKSYTASQLMDFHNKDRKASKKMAKQMKKMYKKEGSAGVEALVEFYSK